ncbi:MAG: 50S ribosomal protein L22 [Armatimonadota bacterium]
MEAQATARFVRMAPRKVRLVLDAIRGKYAGDALDMLRFTPNHASVEIGKVLRSAMANAEHNHDMDPRYLKVARCFVDPGPTMKRVQPRAQGRAYRILKRTSHITVVVAEGPVPPVKTGKQKPKPPLRAALPEPAVVEAVAVEESVATTEVDEAVVSSDAEGQE